MPCNARRYDVVRTARTSFRSATTLAMSSTGVCATIRLVRCTHGPTRAETPARRWTSSSTTMTTCPTWCCERSHTFNPFEPRTDITTEPTISIAMNATAITAQAILQLHPSDSSVQVVFVPSTTHKHDRRARLLYLMQRTDLCFSCANNEKHVRTSFRRVTQHQTVPHTPLQYPVVRWGSLLRSTRACSGTARPLEEARTGPRCTGHVGHVECLPPIAHSHPALGPLHTYRALAYGRASYGSRAGSRTTRASS
jgi:hypothetical protein